MDNVVTLYHGGSVEKDEFGNVSFVGMGMVPLIFDDRPLFSELFGRVGEELHCNSSNDVISVEGILHFGKSGRIFRRLVPIASEGEWEKFVKTVMKNEFQCLDLVVRKLSSDPTPHGYSPLNGFLPESENPDPPVANREVEMEDVVVVPDAQSAPNEVGICPAAQSVATERRGLPDFGRRMTIDSSGGSAKRQRVDELDDQCETVASDAVLVDRISVLPDKLRLRVLSRLPLKYAIRTGALSRRWHDLWTRWAHCASLEVHIRSRDDTQKQLDMLAREPRCRLQRFSLTVMTSTLKSDELQGFLNHAAKCGVEDLHVYTTSSKDYFHLPLLSSPALTCLSLSCINVSRLYNKGARPFHALEVIRLASVSFCRDAFREMMGLCPSLRTLDLRNCSCKDWVFDRLPPKLRSLTIVDCDRICSLDFVRLPSLRSFCYSGFFSNFPLSIPHHAALSDLYIQLFDSVRMKEGNMEKLMKSLPTDLSSLNVLTICYGALMGASVLSADGASAQLPHFNLHSLKELHLIMFEKKAVNLADLYLFLDNFQCPNLERLFLQLPECGYKPMESSNDQVWEDPPENGWDNLVMVKVMNFNWCPSEVQLVSFLLRKARSMRKLVIVSRNVTPVDSPSTPEADISLLKEALVNGNIMLIESNSVATQPYHEAPIKVFW